MTHALRFIAVLTLALALPVQAQTYPVKPVRLIVGFPPGGPTDIVSRLVAPKLSAALGQQVVVENRAGAGGQIATEQVAKAAPDGYTLLMGTIGGIAVAMSLNPKRGYDTLRDLAPITQCVAVTSILVTHPSVPVKSVKELLALAKASPGKLNYASSGNGTVTHLAGELLKHLGKVNITHVPYKGGAPALTALISGEVDLSYENSLIITPHIRSGKVRALGVTGSSRSRLLPDLPTIGETLPGYSASGWYGLFVPARTPKAIVDQLNAATVAALRAADVVDKLSSQGAEPVGNTPDEFTAFVRSEIEKWANLVKVAKMRTD